MGNVQFRNMSFLLIVGVLLLKITIGIPDFVLISGVIISIILRLISMPIIKSYIYKLKGDD
ncbi:hypothetical protein [Senegalia massiliensis]|uniref:hypothetical protein n=1 Tax=Senegalia massiliensis TaxID=1720316 RepID=UPI001030D766|nr:hypothetical protein [Senegalia massiliensis]